MGRNGSLLSKNGWEWVAFLEKWVGVGESGWEWLGVTGSGWDRNSVKPVSVDYGKCIAIVSYPGCGVIDFKINLIFPV